MRQFAMIFLALALCACAPKRDIAADLKQISELPKSCPVPQDIIELLETGPGLTIASETVYPCRSHVTSFGQRSAFGKKGGWVGQGDSEFMQLRMRVFDGSLGASLNQVVTLFRNRHIDFPHTESRSTQNYRGIQFAVSEFLHEYDRSALNLVTISVPLKKCYARYGFCYDHFVFGLYPTFPFGQDQGAMVTIAKQFIDQLGGRNLAIKPKSGDSPPYDNLNEMLRCSISQIRHNLSRGGIATRDLLPYLSRNAESPRRPL